MGILEDMLAQRGATGNVGTDQPPMGPPPMPDISGLPISGSVPGDDRSQAQAAGDVMQQPNPAVLKRGGGVKAFLTNYVDNVGASLTGQPNAYEKQQIEIRNQQVNDRQASLDAERQSMEGLRQQQAKLISDNAEFMEVPAGIGVAMGMPPGTSIPRSAWPGVLQHYQDFVSKQGVADTNKEARLGAADIAANASMNKPSAGADAHRFITLLGKNPASLTDDDKAFLQGYRSSIDERVTKPGVARMNALVRGRAEYTPFETVIPGTNIPTSISNLQALKSGAPKISISAQGKMGGQYALYNDAYGILDNISKLSEKVNLDDSAVRARVTAGYSALKDPASHGVTGEVLSNILLRQPINTQMTDDERALVLNMAQGKAAATGLRSIMGQAGSNQMQQQLDSALFPGGQAAGSKKSVQQQVDATRSLLNRFSPGLPQAGLNAPGTPSSLANQQGPPISKLKEGVPTRFSNGQVWVLQNGKAVQLQPQGAR